MVEYIARNPYEDEAEIFSGGDIDSFFEHVKRLFDFSKKNNTGQKIIIEMRL